MRYLTYIFVVIAGTTLGYIMGSNASTQTCQCGENCKCCAACPGNNGGK